MYFIKTHFFVFFSLGINLIAHAYLGSQDSLLHHKTHRFSVHAQATSVLQYKAGFNALYSGSNSLTTNQEYKNTLTATIFLGVRLWKGARFYIDPELAGGSGLSSALGIGSASNGESFRVGNPAPAPYIARIFYQQIFPLSKHTIYCEPDANEVGGYIPEKYISLTVGKISVTDYFDNNVYTHDPRSQFINWALMDNGAWDYPANIRGYIPSIILEYISPRHEVRYGISLVPRSSNSDDINWNVLQANSNTLEYTYHYRLLKQPGNFRILGFLTSANMGNYLQSIALSPVNPVIQNTRRFGNTKYGFAISVDQAINDYFGAFLRASWNDGNNETWVFTEIDHSIATGLSFTGTRWKRPHDNIGIAYVTSGISKPHRLYLKAGGNGFILGDGNLNYRWEHVIEVYYSVELLKNYIYFTGTYQFFANPGYNLDRKGPVNIFSGRVHLQI